MKRELVIEIAIIVATLIVVVPILQVIVTSMNQPMLGPYAGTILKTRYTCSNFIPYLDFTCIRDGAIDTVRLDNGTMIQAWDSCYGGDAGGVIPPTHANFTYYVNQRLWEQSSFNCL